MADQLAVTYPALAVRTDTGAIAARRLLATGRILPVLDGLDEINSHLRGKAIQEINHALGSSDQLLLTSRYREYAKAAGVIAGAAVVVLADLSLNDIDTYLHLAARSKAPGLPSTWAPVLARLRAADHDLVAESVVAVLRNPLMLSLARTIYSDTATDPKDLFQVASSQDSAQQRRHHIEAHLLSRFIPAAYRSLSDTLGRRWKPEKAHRWLAFLAHTLQTRRADDLGWWQLRSALLSPHLTMGLVFGLTTALLIGLPYGLFIGLGSQRLESGLAAGLSIGLGSGVTVGMTAGIVKPADPHTQWPRLGRRNLTMGLLVLVIAGLGVWLFLGLALGLVTALGSGPTAGLTIALTTMGDGATLSLTLAFGLAFGLLTALKPGTGTDVTRAVSPDSLLRTDRGVTVVRAVVTFVIVGLAAGLLAGLLLESFVGWVIALVFGVASAILTSTSTAWAGSVAARGWLAMSGHVPWSLMSFLSDAHRRGVLRQTGAFYQFRHVQLRDHLATAEFPF
jgi:hypothetical protein